MDPQHCEKVLLPFLPLLASLLLVVFPTFLASLLSSSPMLLAFLLLYSISTGFGDPDVFFLLLMFPKSVTSLLLLAPCHAVGIPSVDGISAVAIVAADATSYLLLP
jgi:hypothetical protein